MSNNEVTPAPRTQLLREAADLITGDRNKTYGSPTQNFQDTADVWNVLLRPKLKDGEQIDPGQVAAMMIALKLVRMIASPTEDNWKDAAGYAGCGFEVDREIGKIPAPSDDSVAAMVRQYYSCSSGFDVDHEPKEEPLWTGGYSDPEPPARVRKLRRVDKVHGAKHYLKRAAENTWYWDWAYFEAPDDYKGFEWPGGGPFGPNHFRFEEVREP